MAHMKNKAIVCWHVILAGSSILNKKLLLFYSGNRALMTVLKHEGLVPLWGTPGWCFALCILIWWFSPCTFKWLVPPRSLWKVGMESWSSFYKQLKNLIFIVWKSLGQGGAAQMLLFGCPSDTWRVEGHLNLSLFEGKFLSASGRGCVA